MCTTAIAGVKLGRPYRRLKSGKELTLDGRLAVARTGPELLERWKQQLRAMLARALVWARQERVPLVDAAALEDLDVLHDVGTVEQQVAKLCTRHAQQQDIAPRLNGDA